MRHLESTTSKRLNPKLLKNIIKIKVKLFQIKKSLNWKSITDNMSLNSFLQCMMQSEKNQQMTITPS